MYKYLKRAFDIVCSFLGLLGTLPLWLVAVIGIEISDPGPVFYMAHRVGKGNRTFRMFKFRSMRQGKANEAVFRGDEDRIFPFGQFIRATKIDELPQLLNIFIGDMSIVGPRPAAVDQLQIVRGGKYAVVGNAQAGLTGPSALYDYIYGDTIEDADDYGKMVLPTRLELDVWYVEHMSAWLDLKMIWWTIVCVLAEIFHKTTPKIYSELVGYVEVT
ncbi:sugar transferase [Fumia xinanensis]|uniref:Sugar transferase n=1 Tax=Fumia xinanensis TaxID=2763659 RepID=A0A926E2X2_9FIRM|nr:sugar transferase [Fumia xinanensis]MBC8560067.1 sugar transferase [Fumia xinanensis]